MAGTRCLGKLGAQVGCDGICFLGCERKASLKDKTKGSKDNSIRESYHSVDTLAKTQGTHH